LVRPFGYKQNIRDYDTAHVLDAGPIFECYSNPRRALCGSNPDLRIVAASDAYLRATMTKREEIVGKTLFETRVRDQFLSTLSHELRNPLHTVIGFAELLAEETGGRLSETQKAFVNHIHKDAMRLLELIDGMTSAAHPA